MVTFERLKPKFIGNAVERINKYTKNKERNDGTNFQIREHLKSKLFKVDPPGIKRGFYTTRDFLLKRFMEHILYKISRGEYLPLFNGKER